MFKPVPSPLPALLSILKEDLPLACCPDAAGAWASCKGTIGAGGAGAAGGGGGGAGGGADPHIV